MMQALNIGSTLQGGKYEILSVLGRGGFGITYLVRHKLLNETFAIKEFFPEDYCNRDDSTSRIKVAALTHSELVEKLRSRFLSEARNLRKLNHPGIVKIYDIFEENDTAYFVMDYIEGYSLEDLIKSGGPLREDIAAKYIMQACSAIAHIHSHRMTHFDIKPANLMVRRSDGKLILIDFGLSKQYNERGHVNSTLLVGISRGFSPPEQYLQEGISSFSPQTDVYSLGASLYYLTVGENPPESISFQLKPLELPASINKALASIVYRSMATNKEARYQSAQEMGEALQEFISEDSATTEVVHPANPDNGDASRTEVRIGPFEPEQTFSKKKLKKIGIILLPAFLIGALIMAIILISRDGADARRDETPVETQPEYLVTSVESLPWKSPLGNGVYSGEVVYDSKYGDYIDTLSMREFIPDGEGLLKITSGELKGYTYKGMFKKGKLEGETIYTTSTGDTFKGTFKDNQYEQGRYTMKSTGEYFEGTFKDGQPADGHWYKSSGEFIE